MRVYRNKKIKNLTTFGIGGHVVWYIPCMGGAELPKAIAYALTMKMPYYIIAGGSNIAFADGILLGILIHIKELPLKKAILRKKNLNLIRVDASVNLFRFIRWCLARGLGGIENLSGIPGTIGGACVGNAGAYGLSMSDVISQVEVYDGIKKYWIKNSECAFRYRHSRFKDERLYVCTVELKLHAADKKELRKKSKEIILLRAKFKPGLKSPGSYFKNILVSTLSASVLSLIDESKIKLGKLPAGYLLEQVGSRGMRVGGISFAEFHGNICINDGTGSYSDLLTIITELKNRVREKFGIILEEEVRRVDASTYTMKF